ncbi:ROK family transcriptional regulator [Myceligenerans cantabricum]
MTTTVASRQYTLRERNLGLVARAVFAALEPPSRADVASATGLTRATVSTLIDQLIGARLVHELPAVADGRAGRPAVPLVPAGRSIVGLGLEVNVDYLGARLVDLTGAIIAERVVPGAFHDSDPAEVLGALGRIARDLADAAHDDGMRLAGARLALPGLVDSRAGMLDVAPNLGWSSVEPVPLLRLPGVAVEVANEAKLAALAELGGPGAGGVDTGATDADRAAADAGTGDADADADRAGADAAGAGAAGAGAAGAGAAGAGAAWAAPEATARGAGVVSDVPESFLYVSGDVGIGAAIVVGRELFLGERGWNGEVGHVVVDPAGPRCSCGAHGCLEQFAGKEALSAAAGLAADAPLAALLALLGQECPQTATPGPAHAGAASLPPGRAPAADLPAHAALRRAGRALGAALADFVNLVDVHTVVLGGIYTDLLPWLRPEVEAVLAERVLAAPFVDLEVRAARAGTQAALTGGAREVLRGVLAAPAAWL